MSSYFITQSKQKFVPSREWEDVSSFHKKFKLRANKSYTAKITYNISN